MGVVVLLSVAGIVVLLRGCFYVLFVVGVVVSVAVVVVATINGLPPVVTNTGSKIRFK